MDVIKWKKLDSGAIACENFERPAKNELDRLVRRVSALKGVLHEYDKRSHDYSRECIANQLFEAQEQIKRLRKTRIRPKVGDLIDIGTQRHPALVLKIAPDYEYEHAYLVTTESGPKWLNAYFAEYECSILSR